jgi:hypothetical protein
MRNLIILLALSISFSSCVEIIDDISFKLDGSGTFKYTVNLSDSKVKINSILALDSLDGKKVPDLSDIKEIIAEYKIKLVEKSGISNVKVETDFTNFILKLQFDFEDVQSLQTAIKDIVIEKDKKQQMKEINYVWLIWDGNKLIRSVPNISSDLAKRLKKDETDALKTGSYTSITRFEKVIEKCDNPKANLSKSLQACMVKTNTFALVNNLNLLQNTIYLSGTK